MISNAMQQEEMKEKPISLVVIIHEKGCPLLKQSENLPKILRLTGYLLRFRFYLVDKNVVLRSPSPSGEEISKVLLAHIHWTQKSFFAEEIKLLTTEQSCSVCLRK